MKTMIILCFIILVISFPAAAGELYTWIDENGQTQITDHPPDKPGQVIGRDKYREMSPREIQLNQELNQMQWEHYQQREKSRQVMNELEIKYQKAREERIDKTHQIIEDLKARKEQYKHNEMNSNDAALRLEWRNRIRQIDNVIKDHERSLND